MTDRQWNDYMTRMEGTFYGDLARKDYHAYRPKPNPSTYKPKGAKKVVGSSPEISKEGKVTTGNYEFSYFWGIVAFMAISIYTYTASEMGFGAMIFGFLGGLFAGRYYKAILLIGVLAGLIWVLHEADY